jgi:hypothetical protein
MQLALAEDWHAQSHTILAKEGAALEKEGLAGIWEDCPCCCQVLVCIADPSSTPVKGVAERQGEERESSTPADLAGLPSTPLQGEAGRWGRQAWVSEDWLETLTPSSCSPLPGMGGM